MRIIAIGTIKFQRTEEEKVRRRIFGDKGARYKVGKTPWIDYGGICPAISTLVYTDLPVCEVYETDTHN